MAYLIKEFVHADFPVPIGVFKAPGFGVAFH